jgi:hypothetical protein
MDWKSGGDTNFAPLASAFGEMECESFSQHGKSDKNGVWTKNADMCPTLVAWVKGVNANFGRVRTIKLNPNTEEEAIANMHLDDNNGFNPHGEGWVVRAWLQLSDDRDSYMLLRDDLRDVQSRVSLPRNRQIVIDSQRIDHAVWHAGPKPRYALITSFESDDALKRWVERQS